MYVISIDGSGELEPQLRELDHRPPQWALLYGVEDSPFVKVMAAFQRRFPRVPVFGASSFQGVFSANGFRRGLVLLAGELVDSITSAVALESSGAAEAEVKAHAACRSIETQLQQRPSLLLLHATPGFEERILAGVRAAYGNDVPVYGGSAADDSLSGRWRVFANGSVAREGFLMVGLSSRQAPAGGFLGGYLPTEHTGKVTRASGRIVHEISGRPAAEVYNVWSGGAIADELESGGNVLLKTNLHPLGRTVGSSSAMPRRLLAHPHEVLPQKALSFFTEFTRGDEVTLMTSTRDPLISRVRRVVQRARGSGRANPRGALLVYCGGCLGMMLDQGRRIAAEFQQELAGVPFIGIATFGEQGTFFERSESWHGNLMCSAVLF
jgi:hypothetical protein